MQEISHLKKILNNESINEHHILTYCNDKIDQILYITQSRESKIKVIFMKDHHCEDCFHTYEYKGENQLANHLLNQPANHVRGTYRRSEQNTKIKGQGEKTRLKQKSNYLSHKIKNKYYNLCQEELNEGDEDQINIDIETQQVVVLKNKEDLDESFKCSGTHGKEKNAKVFSSHIVFEYVHETQRDPKQKEVQACYVDLEESQISEMACQYVSKNQTCWVFVIKVIAYVNQQKQHSFIIIQKTNEELEELMKDFADHSIHESKKKNLIGVEDTIKLIVSDDEFTQEHKDKGKKIVALKDIHIMDIPSIHQQSQQKKRPTKKLIFEKYIDSECFELQYIPLIYQENGNQHKTRLVFYDITKNDIIKIQSINPNKRNFKYLYQDDSGFYPFKLCRASDIKSENIQKKSIFQKEGSKKIQSLKIQIFTLYVEKLGRVQQQEFLVQYASDTDDAITLRHISQKNLFMSKKCIQESDWTQLMNSQAVPFLDEHGNTIGSQLILKINKNRKSYINLIEDSKHNNMFTYRSQIVMVGQKRMQLVDADPDDFIYIISAKIREDVMEKFTMQEVYTILRSVQENIIEMRRPDLHYLLMNTFDTLKKNDFFVLQEVLDGRSICDICLSDTKTIKEALNMYDPSHIKIENSIIYEFAREDRMRLEALKDIGFYPKNQIINHDFNFIGTIYRGIETKAKKSVKLLIHHLQEVINTPGYYNLLMLDLHEILETQEMSLNQFFNNQQKEEHDEDDDEVDDDGVPIAQGYLNIEIPLNDDSLPQLDERSKVFTVVDDVRTMHELDQELIEAVNQGFAELRSREPNWYQKIIQSMTSWVDDDEKEKHEIGHSYIDFKYLIIGEKIKHMGDDSPEQEPFGDQYFASVMLTQADNLQFFQQTTVMKFIDYQFIRARKFHSMLFWFYIYFFQIPYIVTLISENPAVHRWIFNFCLFPQIPLFGIEIIQLYENGPIDYFQGWNIIDISQISVFFILWVIIVWKGKSDEYEYTPFLKIGMVVLSLIKCIHFFSVFERAGFFITMLQKCTEDLYPFLFSYILFCAFFAVLYATMNVEGAGELAPAHGLGYFGKLFLTVWRNSVGKLGFARYYKLYDNVGTTTGGKIAIYIIWAIYMIQIIFMLVVMLNFMIAIIDQTYKQVMEQKKMIIYQNKADLNFEYYQVRNWFSPEREYRVLVFSTCKDYEVELDKQMDVNDDRWEAFQDGIIKTYKQNNDKYIAQCKQSVQQCDEILDAQKQFELKLDSCSQKYSEMLEELKKKVKERDNQILGVPENENQKMRFQISSHKKIKLDNSRRQLARIGLDPSARGGAAQQTNAQPNDITFRNPQNQS